MWRGISGHSVTGADRGAFSYQLQLPFLGNVPNLRVCEPAVQQQLLCAPTAPQWGQSWWAFGSVKAGFIIELDSFYTTCFTLFSEHTVFIETIKIQSPRHSFTDID